MMLSYTMMQYVRVMAAPQPANIWSLSFIICLTNLSSLIT